MSEQTKSPRLNRRTFAAILAGTGAAAPVVLAQQSTPPTAQPTPAPAGAPNPNTSVQQQQQQRRTAPAEVLPFDAPIEFARKDVPVKAQPFAIDRKSTR